MGERKQTESAVDYALLDPFKVEAQRVAASTDGNITRLGLQVVPESRGESVFLISGPDGMPAPLIGGVTETLGTKNLIADAIRPFTGKTHYDAMAQDTVAMIVNDTATLGVLPVVVGQLLHTGSTRWFNDTERSTALITGWKSACDLSRSVYGPGETAALSGLVAEDSAILSGFALGVIPEDSERIRGDIEPGDAIVLFESSGIHANGLTNARSLASRLPDGYESTLSDGQTYGEALVTPTIIYVPIIEDCLHQGIPIHYAVHITGHGWRKLMRSPRRLVYVVDTVPEPPPVLKFIQEHNSMSNADAYGTFNMGAGFAVYVPEAQAAAVMGIALTHGVKAWNAGYVEAMDDRRSVIIRPLGIEYQEQSLSVR